MIQDEIITRAIADNADAAEELGQKFTDRDAQTIRDGRLVAWITVVMPQYKGSKARVFGHVAWQGSDGQIYWTPSDDSTDGLANAASVTVTPNHFRGFMGPEIAGWYGRKFLPDLPIVANVK